MSSFYSIDLYPEIGEIIQHIDMLQDEAMSVIEHMTTIQDSRINSEKWLVLPLKPEEEDKNFISDTALEETRKLAPKTVSLLDKYNLHAYAFSVLKPGGHILPHRHSNPYVTASVCLSDGGNSYIKVNKDEKRYISNEVIIFDYTQLHEIYNQGNEDRLVLLLLLDNRSQN